jgi:hypothetical protein
LSNVFGKVNGTDTFLTSLLHDALTVGKIRLQSARESAKDYIDIQTVIQLLPRISMEGRHRLYNVAAGQNTQHGEIVDVISTMTGCTVEVMPGAPKAIFPKIDVRRMRSEFVPKGEALLTRLPQVIEQAKLHYRTMQSKLTTQSL